jgi:predicted enzyme related to lactoylglutathione lyase
MKPKLEDGDRVTGGTVTVTTVTAEPSPCQIRRKGEKFMSIQFTDICFITKDVLRLRAFYEAVFGGKADGDEIHSTLGINGAYFVFMMEKTDVFYFGMTDGASNTILSFNIDDGDTEYKRLLTLGADMQGEPITHPWGTRSFQFKDPDGNILNFRSLPKGEAK